MSIYPCPLCNSEKTIFFTHTRQRDYMRCKHCEFVFVPPIYFLTKSEEKKRYDLHENNIENKGYRDFLNQVVTSVLEKRTTTKNGLDYGSGPHPVLATLLEIEGYTMHFFDPFYANNSNVLKRKYDFITCTEVVEHFHNPAREFELLISMLKPDGILFIMTSRTDNVVDFDNWHYQKDETHVSFYAKKSLEYVAKKYNLECFFINKSIAYIKK